MKNLLIFIISFIVVFVSYSIKPSVAFSFVLPLPPSTDSQRIESEDLSHWTRPTGPIKVALQIGHLNIEQLPQEQAHLREDTGAVVNNIREVEVNQSIAQKTAAILKENGIQVDILPATIPKHYYADAFVAIHADASDDPTRSGFKLATPTHDLTGRDNELENRIIKSYENTTHLPLDEENITLGMSEYYAFSWWKTNHSLHPMTPAVIVETGYISNTSDQQIIVDNPEIAAKGIATGILSFLKLYYP